MNNSFDLNRIMPLAIILPELTGLIIFVLKEVVNTNASITAELTAKYAASSNNLKYTAP